MKNLKVGQIVKIRCYLNYEINVQINSLHHRSFTIKTDDKKYNGLSCRYTEITEVLPMFK